MTGHRALFLIRKGWDWHISGNILFLDYEAPAGVEVLVKPKGRLETLELVVNSFNKAEMKE